MATGNTFRLTLDDGMVVRIADDKLVERFSRLSQVTSTLAKEGTSASYVVLDGEDLEHVAYQERGVRAVSPSTDGGG